MGCEDHARAPKGTERRRPGVGGVPPIYSRAMSVRPIITLGDPRLRLQGLPVDSFGKYLHELLDDLTDSMRARARRRPRCARSWASRSRRA